MPLEAAFAEADITPPVGTHKLGWLKVVVADRVLDPLRARAAVFQCADRRAAFIQLDTCFVDAADVREMRRRIDERLGFPGECVMIAATHNHAGPAVADCGDVTRDDEYTEGMMEKVVAMFGRALEALRPAEIGLGSAAEFDLSFNRRVVLRDGTVSTQHAFDPADSLYVEGPIDPEVAVLAARDDRGRLMGALVNFACHPTHHGGEGGLSAGFPGALAAEMARRGCPVTLFLNGAAGNLMWCDYAHGGRGSSMEHIGRKLADDALGVIERMAFRPAAALACRSREILLPYRAVSDDDVRGTARGAERFIDSAIYDRMIPRVLEQMRRSEGETVEVQLLSIDEHDFVGVPAEYFVQNGLRIKEKAHPRRAIVVSCANGCVGYVPHAEAFGRGGYELTFPSGRFVPGAGRLLADCALELIAAGAAP
jgi:neutral ceramidase